VFADALVPPAAGERARLFHFPITLLFASSTAIQAGDFLALSICDRTFTVRPPTTMSGGKSAVLESSVIVAPPRRTDLRSRVRTLRQWLSLREAQR